MLRHITTELLGRLLVEYYSGITLDTLDTYIEELQEVAEGWTGGVHGWRDLLGLCNEIEFQVQRARFGGNKSRRNEFNLDLRSEGGAGLSKVNGVLNLWLFSGS
jgi:hypothetical protein